METVPVTRERTGISVNDFVTTVYNWMCIGLALTGLIVFNVSASETMVRLGYG
jgi:FtsH-binding integral membrane protein